MTRPLMFLGLLLATLLLPATAQAAKPLPTTLLGFGRHATMQDMFDRLGKKGDLSGTRNTMEYYYSWLNGQLSTRLQFVAGDTRIQQIVVSYWPDEERDLAAVQDSMGKLNLNTPELAYLQQTRPDLVRMFGEPPDSSMESWLTYPLEEGGSFEWYVGGDPPRATEMTLRFDYPDVPAQYAVDIPAMAQGRDNLRARDNFFGLHPGLTADQITSFKGEPQRKEVWSEDYPDWYYTSEDADITVTVSLSKVTEWDAEYTTLPGAFLLNRMTLQIPYLDNVRDLDAALAETAAAGWDDPLLADLGSTRADLRARYGDPDSYSGFNWSYEAPQADWTLAIDFNFTGSSESARVTGVTISRW